MRAWWPYVCKRIAQIGRLSPRGVKRGVVLVEDPAEGVLVSRGPVVEARGLPGLLVDAAQTLRLNVGELRRMEPLTGWARLPGFRKRVVDRIEWRTGLPG